jgi:hypothetical protein
MAKPYLLVNETQNTLATAFVRGTDTSVVLASAANFPTGGGYVRVGDNTSYCLLAYTGISTATLTGITNCTLGVVVSSGDETKTWPIGTVVSRVWVAEDAADLITGPASATSGHFFKADGTTGKLAKASAITAAELPTTITPTKVGYVTALANDHDWWGDYTTEAVGETVAFGELLYFDCSEVEWKKADFNAEGTMPCTGMALEAKNNGEACLILKWGGVRHDAWAWAVTDAANTKTLYCGAAGAMQVAPVSGTGDFSQAVGFVKTATTIEFCPALPMAKVA